MGVSGLLEVSGTTSVLPSLGKEEGEAEDTLVGGGGSGGCSGQPNTSLAFP